MKADPIRLIDRRGVEPVGTWGARVLVEVTCPHCGQVHRHHWRATDPDPGLKDPSCVQRGTGMYWVPAPPPASRADLTRGIQQAQRALARLSTADMRVIRGQDARDLLAVVLACAALVDATDRIIGP